ncbi:hypothetical protein MYFR107205_10645 [Mycolicibacterium frederiksbergense]|uniref:hypothetical protein n=1 Tax=Mycolicibacterium frederiksbergense TaxID=117567 RepID=UPI0021F2895B|nr:hypothetical protein [Mycolicibacterium frederiksbergense]
MMRFSIDGWDPGYGSALELLDLSETSAKVDTTLEVLSSSWEPVPPVSGGSVPAAVLFVDGVRRIDARTWIDDAQGADGDGARAAPGLCASYAAGVVCSCAAGAHLVTSEVRRGLFTDAHTGAHIDTGSGRYAFHRTVSSPDQPPTATLTNAVQRALTDLEITVAVDARTEGHTGDDDLLIVDGPLRGRAHLPRALGYVKSHNAQYLPHELNNVVAELGTNERTPVFAIGGSWDRYSWYLRLPCLPAGPWAGIVRLEAAIELPLTDVVELANITQSLLGRFASVEYKDGRAPQNLVPIAGLERELKHRLGLAPMLYRDLRAAASIVA